MKTSITNHFVDCLINKETPTAHISVNKSRIKNYYDLNDNPVYYLSDGQEFMIELFNPTRNSVLAKIKLNGYYISESGIILKPGERVFLDRFINSPKKFKFETYEVSNTKETKNAIKNNGDVEVEFYSEKIYFNYYSSNTPPFNNGWIGTAPYTEYNNYTANCSNTINPSFNVTNDTYLTKNIETGRVGQGSNSSQSMIQAYGEFNPWTINVVRYKILPKSQKPVYANEVVTRRYCTECGAKIKNNFKFCPSCGSKV